MREEEEISKGRKLCEFVCLFKPCWLMTWSFCARGVEEDKHQSVLLQRVVSLYMHVWFSPVVGGFTIRSDTGGGVWPLCVASWSMVLRDTTGSVLQRVPCIDVVCRQHDFCSRVFELL
jgi:hypothetical protein